MFFENTFDFYRKANVDHQVLVVGGLGANLVFEEINKKEVIHISFFLQAK